MKAFQIELADCRIALQCLYERTKTYCKEYLVPENRGLQPQMTVKITPADIAYERDKSQAADNRAGVPIRSFSDQYLETLAVYRKIAEGMLDASTLLFHGSVIAVDGVGYLFTAKSGTGKSTHARLWQAHFGHRAVMVNDDKPLLRVGAEGVTAYGTPWAGKHHLSSNIAVPLRAICILNRDRVNHIEAVPKQSVYPLLLQQTYRSEYPQQMIKTLQLLDTLLSKVKIYQLGCNMNPEAARIASAEMCREQRVLTERNDQCL